MRLFFVALIAATAPIILSAAEPTSSPANTSQQTPSQKQAQIYLEKYAEQLAPWKEVRFTYSGYTTRSTPSEGLVAKWESSGDFRLSAARKSFHFTSPSKLAELTDKPDMTPQDLGIEECLVTPDTCLRLGIVKDKRGESVSVEIKQRRQDDEWSDELSRHPLAMLVGYVPCQCESRSLLNIARSASCQNLAEQDLDSTRLSGFLAQCDDLQIRALFDPVGPHALKRIEASRPAARARGDGVDGVNKEILTILEVRYAGGLPSDITLKVSRRLNGGVINRSDCPPGLSVAGVPETMTIEPQTYDYYFKINNIVYREEPGSRWFALDHAIPDGSSVIVDGDYRKVYEWRDGKVGETPVGEIAD